MIACALSSDPGNPLGMPRIKGAWGVPLSDIRDSHELAREPEE